MMVSKKEALKDVLQQEILNHQRDIVRHQKEISDKQEILVGTQKDTACKAAMLVENQILMALKKIRESLDSLTSKVDNLSTPEECKKKWSFWKAPRL